MTYRDLLNELDTFEKEWLENQTDSSNYSLVKLTILALRRKCEFLYAQYKLDQFEWQELKKNYNRIKKQRRKYRNQIQILDNRLNNNNNNSINNSNNETA